MTPAVRLSWFFLVCPALAWGVSARDIQQRVGVDPNIGHEISLSTRFHDEGGRLRSLGDVIGGRPTIVAMVYFDCPNLCTMTLNGLATSARELEIRRYPAIDYRVIAISIDPREGPAQAATKQNEIRAHWVRTPCRECDARWHFLTGEEASIRTVSDALGYRYFWDSGQAQYAHPAGVVILSGTGRIIQYLNGLEFPPSELQQALTLAVEGRSGSLAQRLWLLCYHYEALAGRYSHQISAMLRFLGLVTVAALALLLFRLIRVRA
jgi:protein SCO1/2